MPYPPDPVERAALLELLGSTWPHVPGAVARAARWGAEWVEVSTPFARWMGPRPISLVGVIEMPLRLAGRDVTVAGVHGVCTHPAYRGRGYFRDAMEEALAWIDARVETAVLWTEEPAIYERFGFRVAREHLFEIAGARAGGAERGRALDLDRAPDLALLRALAAERAPLSDRLAPRDPGWHTLIDLALLGEDAPRLVHLADLDAIVATTERDGTLRIDDVIARRRVTLDDLLARLVSSADRIELAFCPEGVTDRPAIAIPHPATDVLMVRGAWPVDPPFSLPPLVRC